MHNICLALVLGILMLVASCRSDDTNAVPAPDVSGVEINLAVQHFERDLARAAADTSYNGATVLRQEYPLFFDSVWLQLMVPGGRGREVDSGLVAAFRVQPALARLLDSVQVHFPAGQQQPWEADLEQALRYAKYYFPERPVPQVISYVSELGLGAFTYGDQLLGVGLDFYMGSDFAGYDPNVFPRYIQRTMTPAHIAPRAIEAYVSNILGEPSGDRMLDQMVQNGKLLYLKRRLLPRMADTAVLGFSESHLAWLRGNEPPMWAHYLDEELLYETKPSRIGKHVDQSPNVPGMPPEAPGGGANWIGMRIVEAWVRRHPEATLQQLIDVRDPQVLMEQGRYKPR